MDVTIVKPLARQLVDYWIQAAKAARREGVGRLPAAPKTMAMYRITIYVSGSSTYGTRREQDFVATPIKKKS